ncbi:MAG: glycosyltransferase family 4 protein [Acidobacteriaceae bacterium]|nr:glycosyltransferase family 4 protein [Acidobacteriaceae bacterium]
MSGGPVDTVHAVTSSLSLVLLRGQMRYLKAAGFHPAALSGPGPFVAEIGIEESIPLFTVPMEREVSLRKDFLSLWRIWRVLRRIRPLICNAGTPKAGLLVTLAAWLARIPCRVYTLRGLRMETARGWQRSILCLTERIACACAHRVICVSPSLRERAIRLKLVCPKKAMVLGPGSSNGIDVGRFAPTPLRLARASQIRQDLNLGGQRVVGYIGRFTRDKGVSELVAAFDMLRQRFQDASLLLIGTYEEGDAIDSAVRARIDAGSGILVLPFKAEISPYYLVMDVFVLPTHREGFPNTVLEAQVAERPVVTTRATGAVDSVVDGETGLLVPVGDAVALAKAIGKLLDDPAMRQRMGKAGRERVERQFRQEMLWSQLAELYRVLLRQRGLPVPAEARKEKLCLHEQ